MLTASFLRSAFNWPGNLEEKKESNIEHKFISLNKEEYPDACQSNLSQDIDFCVREKMCHLRQVVTPDMVMETRWLRSP